MKPMKKSEFIRMVTENPDGEWLAAQDVARHLDLHIPASEQVAAWLRLDDHMNRDPKVFGVTLVLTEHYFLRVSAIVSQTRDAAQVEVESVPLGRLRSVKTRAGAPAGGVTILDFAGRVLQDVRADLDGDQIVIRETNAWPSPAVKEFLDTLAAIRK